MAPFFQVYARRSDGKLQTAKTGSIKDAKEPNEPLPEQLITKPNAQGISDFYRPCLPGHAKEIDWRRKLAGMLIREIGTPDMQGERNFSFWQACVLTLLKIRTSSSPHFLRTIDSMNISGSKPQTTMLIRPRPRHMQAEVMSVKMLIFTVTHKAERSDTEALRTSFPTCSGLLRTRLGIQTTALAASVHQRKSNSKEKLKPERRVKVQNPNRKPARSNPMGLP